MYISTRGNDKATASEAIVKGLAKDGGLFIFDKLPDFKFDESLLDLSYNELAFKILRAFLDDFSDEDIKECIDKAYNDSNFPRGMIRMRMTMEYGFLNLYNGPTYAFKDMALTILPYLLEKAKKNIGDNRKTVILTATSGDTGSAALSGFSKLKDNKVIVLYPNNNVSNIQEAQMLSFKGQNAYPIAVNGNFDDCQTAVKKIFSTYNNENIALSSANSINIGRLIPQIIYYFYAYLELVRNEAIRLYQHINVSVPTGNFGNILACYIAKMLGLPIDDIICASNENHVLTDFFNTGIYDIRREFKKTNSPSMDILISSNLERYLYLILKNPKKVSKLMDDLKTKGYFELPEIKDLSSIKAYYTTERETVELIGKEYKYTKILMDPHTAVAFNGYLKSEKKRFTIVVSTASAYKFSDTILEGLGLPDLGDEFKNIYQIEQLTGKIIDPRMKSLMNQTLDKDICNKEDIIDKVTNLLGGF